MLDYQQMVSDKATQESAAFKTHSNLICGDVIKVLKKLPTERKFDVIIIDPPYNIGKDFGNNNDTMPIEAYVAWSREYISLCFDLMAHNGVMYIYGFPEILARIACHYPIDEQRWLVWHYMNKAVPSAKFWQRSHESILCLWAPNTKRPVLEIDQIREPYSQTYLDQSVGKVRTGTPSRFGGKRNKKTLYAAHENGALPRDVIKIPALAGGAGTAERWFMCHECGDKLYPPSELKHHREHDVLKHPTQKPLELTKRLIRSRIKIKNGRVLIPFAGSGSECVAAASMGISYTGIELNPTYVDFATKWIKQCMK
ncbi:MAG: site-specific DNA-methyltransferase [Alphaproteobacteria bacterium]